MFVFTFELDCNLQAFEKAWAYQIHFIFFLTRQILNFKLSFFNKGYCYLHTFYSSKGHSLFQFHNFAANFLLFTGHIFVNLLTLEMLGNLKIVFFNIFNIVCPLNFYLLFFVRHLLVCLCKFVCLSCFINMAMSARDLLYGNLDIQLVSLL